MLLEAQNLVPQYVMGKYLVMKVLLIKEAIYLEVKNIIAKM